MDLTRDFLEKIEEMTEPCIDEVDGHTYSDKKLNLVAEPVAAPIEATTLTSLIDYLQDNRDALDPREIIIQVRAHDSVWIRSNLNKDMERSLYVSALASTPSLNLNDFMNREAFNIMLQANFANDHDCTKVLGAIGKMRLDNSVKLEDDGVTQKVSSSAGVVLVKEETIPNPVLLAPYRTFAEVEQPASSFVLRVNNHGEVGLFEADGGAWKSKAMQSIKDYLDSHLNGEKTGEEKHYSIIA